MKGNRRATGTFLRDCPIGRNPVAGAVGGGLGGAAIGAATAPRYD